MKEIGEKNSTKRTPQQTENARFWLTVVPLSHQPLARQIVIAKNMSVLDSARFMSLVAMAATDALIAVFDAKYHYTFWRPITAIRNGDIDDNPATERVATWQPIDITPLHPEYPCAHCIVTGAVAGAITAMLGTEQIPEVVMTSPSAPGVTHKYHQRTGFQQRGFRSTYRCGLSLAVFDRCGQRHGVEDRCQYRSELHAAVEGCDQVI